MADVSAIILAILGALLSILAIGLVSGWAGSDNGPKDHEWLEKINWTDKVFGWHPVLMVSGFFFCQLHSMITWTLIPKDSVVVQKFMFWFWQCGAVATFISAMVAVVKYKLDNKFDALTSLHSWIGVMAIVIFGINFIYGSMTDFAKDIANKCNCNYDPKFIHKTITVLCLFFTVTAIVTGIVNRLGRTGCYYLHNHNNADANPASRYAHIPNSCKLAYGTGLATVFAAIFALLGLMIDGFNPSEYKAVGEGKAAPETAAQPHEENEKNTK